MNIILVGINSKYIHPNLALRYLKANCLYATTIKEYTIKDDIEYVINDLLKDQPQVLAFSVYIWNLTMVKTILERIRPQNKDIKVVLGGPEVSYQSENLIESDLADFIITGEGEFAFNDLIHSLDNKLEITEVPNLIYKDNNVLHHNKTKIIKDLNTIKNPYHFVFDHLTLRNKINYVELSRGCPFKCSYCLASLENELRYFDMDKVMSNIEYLYERGARTFKFLDRSFNTNSKLAMQFFRHIIARGFEDAVFQFEINGDILTDDLIDYLNKNCPENLVRFEIGIQSTNDNVNRAVHRYQNTDKLINNIKKLIDGPITLHLDLIAGLPNEDLNSFILTFDTVFKLYAKELQLGFLKILKGTLLAREATKYGYEYSQKPPYEIVKNAFMSKKDLEMIHVVEDVLDTFWNKGFMYNSIKYLTSSLDSPFKLFYELGQYLMKNNFSLHNYQLDQLFSVLAKFAKEKMADDEAVDHLKYDYLNHQNIKPKLFWNNNHIKKNEILREFHSYHSKYSIDDLYKYALVTDYMDKYLIVIYFPDEKLIHVF